MDIALVGNNLAVKGTAAAFAGIVAARHKTVGTRRTIAAVAVAVAGIVAVVVLVAGGMVAVVGRVAVGKRPVLVAAVVGLQDMLDSGQPLGQVLSWDQEVMHCHQTQLCGRREDRLQMLQSAQYLVSRTHWLSCCPVVHHCFASVLGHLRVDSQSFESLDSVRKLFIYSKRARVSLAFMHYKTSSLSVDSICRYLPSCSSSRACRTAPVARIPPSNGVFLIHSTMASRSASTSLGSYDPKAAAIVLEMEITKRMRIDLRESKKKLKMNQPNDAITYGP